VETQGLYYGEMKIVIDCDKLKKRKDLRKVVKWKKEVGRERKEKEKKARV